MYIEVVDAGHPITRIGGRLWLPVHRKGLPPPPWPLLVFQHGYFAWEACLLDEGGIWCPYQRENWPAHRQSFSGFDDLGRHLASQGVAFFSQDCREAEVLGAGGSPASRDLHYRVNLFFSAIETLRRVAGIPIDVTRIAIGGHSNGGAAAILAQGQNRAQDLGYAIRSIVAADHNSGRAGEFGEGDTLGLSHLLALTGGVIRRDATSLWAAHSTLGRLTVVEHEHFNHFYLNSRWAEFVDDPQMCSEGERDVYGARLTGPALAAELADLSSWMKCYVGVFCAATLMSRTDAWEFLREDHRPYLPAGHSRVVSVSNKWVLGG